MMFAIFITIVAALAAFAAIIIPLTASEKQENMFRIQKLMDAHEDNLRSGDPAKVAESKERWQKMCRAIQLSSPRNAVLFYELEQWGKAIERRLGET